MARRAAEIQQARPLLGRKHAGTKECFAQIETQSEGSSPPEHPERGTAGSREGSAVSPLHRGLGRLLEIRPRPAPGPLGSGRVAAVGGDSLGSRSGRTTACAPPRPLLVAHPRASRRRTAERARAAATGLGYQGPRAASTRSRLADCSRSRSDSRSLPNSALPATASAAPIVKGPAKTLTAARASRVLLLEQAPGRFQRSAQSTSRRVRCRPDH